MSSTATCRKPAETRSAQPLTGIRTGEMQPYYIMRYGFYEGHTMWRADPIAIAFIFGLRSAEELADAFGDDLYARLTRHYAKGDIAE